jgi:hypothetical protein
VSRLCFLLEKGIFAWIILGLKNIRKRHILVDVMGLLLMVVVHAADIQDRDGAKLVMEKYIGNRKTKR